MPTAVRTCSATASRKPHANSAGRPAKIGASSTWMPRPTRATPHNRAPAQRAFARMITTPVLMRPTLWNKTSGTIPSAPRGPTPSASASMAHPTATPSQAREGRRWEST